MSRVLQSFPCLFVWSYNTKENRNLTHGRYGDVTEARPSGEHLRMRAARLVGFPQQSVAQLHNSQKAFPNSALCSFWERPLWHSMGILTVSCNWGSYCCPGARSPSRTVGCQSPHYIPCLKTMAGLRLAYRKLLAHFYYMKCVRTFRIQKASPIDK